jgi:hypothetical protein
MQKGRGAVACAHGQYKLVRFFIHTIVWKKGARILSVA